MFFIVTGHVGWGISWYINGLLIPEINVVRGKTYTFVVEGGLDPETPARYHPFYITDDAIGGYEHKTLEERAVRIIYGLIICASNLFSLTDPHAKYNFLQLLSCNTSRVNIQIEITAK